MNYFTIIELRHANSYLVFDKMSVVSCVLRCGMAIFQENLLSFVYRALLMYKIVNYMILIVIQCLCRTCMKRVMTR